ncbi:MAG: hypothetical protein CML46_05025 [Rhodobacteraceae bacterium]|nr:hypothetical protein [Paracoccaceae bacterium]MBR26296.1 hypothetical protein [Paracoccaceae bacterium]|tara:strand:+ start:195 stop:494 length:300 start_codon:yes stop_codon:yes gene_type:complete
MTAPSDDPALLKAVSSVNGALKNGFGMDVTALARGALRDASGAPPSHEEVVILMAFALGFYVGARRPVADLSQLMAEAIDQGTAVGEAEAARHLRRAAH